MSSLSAVLSARAALSDLTPLLTNCGRLCGFACCKGDEQTGMLLFKKDGSPRVKLDVRAKAVCPLYDYGVIGLRTEFVAAAKTAYAALMEDDECAAFLRALDEAFSL